MARPHPIGTSTVRRAIRRRQTDYLVIGRGIAGLRAAIELSRHGRVLVVSKSRDVAPATLSSRSALIPRKYRAFFTPLPRHVDQGSSAYAQGGIAVALNTGDRVTRHYDDTITAGRGLCSAKAVQVLVTDGVRRVRELLAWGVPFDRCDGKLHFTRESAHSRHRILHAHGDATGEVILHTLLARLRRCRTVTFLNHHFTIDLLVSDSRCRGALILDESDERLLLITAKAVILATGGAGQLYQRTTNPAVCTGDGMAIAYRAGAKLQDLEFVQFHPTSLATTTAPAFLITEAVRGEGAVIRSHTGRRFLFDAHSAGELAPRDLVARAIWTEMQRHREPWVWLDATHLDPGYLRTRFPTVDATCLRNGLDITKEPIPVCPAAHFFMGGVATDHHGASTLDGLYAAGEVACSGVHGANRLASNSLLEGLVFGWRAARAAVRQCGGTRQPLRAAQRRLTQTVIEPGRWTGQTISPDEIADRRREIQQLMWQRLGVMRNGPSLEVAASFLDHVGRGDDLHVHDRAGFEYRNLFILSRLLTRAASARKGSVGAHFREDFHTKGRNWRRHQTAVISSR